MACKILKQKIHDTLQAGYFNDTKDFVDVSDGAGDFHSCCRCQSKIQRTHYER